LKKNVKFVYQDISESMLALKNFLKLRESRPEFIPIKERGAIGLPCIVVNDGEKIIFEYDEEALTKP
jgi:glutaredoxin-related protein